MPTVANTTARLETTVRALVGVSSTINVNDGTEAAASPKPTARRSTANNCQLPSGTNAIAPAPNAQIR